MPQPPTDDNGRIFGYARVSRARGRVIRKIDPDYEPPEHPSEPSVKRQIAALTEWAEKRGKSITIKFDEGISGAEVSYKERPGLQAVVAQMEKGDRLVVWRLDRLDRGMGKMIEAALWIVEQKGLFLHTLYEQSGDALDLDSTQGKILLHVYSMLATIENESRRAATKAGIDYCKNVGLRYTRYPGYGRCFKTVRNGKETQQFVVWDEHECDIIREIVHRRDVGCESWYRIGLSLHNRGEKSPGGAKWLTWSRHTIRKGDQGQPYRVKKVYAWYKTLLLHGMDLGEPGVPAGIESLAKEFGLSLDEVRSCITTTSAETLRKNYKQGRPKTIAATRRHYKERKTWGASVKEDVD